MSNPEEIENYVPDTQETYYEGSNKEVLKETQNTSLSDSQDFHLVDSQAEESLTEKAESPEDEVSNCQKSVKQLDLQQMSPDSSQMDDKLINDKENKIVEDKAVSENEPIKKIEDPVSSDICNLEKKAELSDNDEDEVIQGTPPHKCYTPSKTAPSDVENVSLKRKADIFDEPLAKILRMTSKEDATSAKERKEEEEESRQSCKSDDSYEDLFKDIRPNVIIEETQDPFTQDSLKSSVTHPGMANNDKTQEQTNQQRDKVFPPEKCDVEKDENLNVSAKLTDVSANDSTEANLHESDSRIEDDNLSIETKLNDPSSSTPVADDERSETDRSLIEAKGAEEAVLDEGDKAQTNGVESQKTDDNDEEISSSRTKVSNAQSSVKTASSYKSRMSIELVYDATNKNIDEAKLKPEVVEIDDDGEKIVLDSSTEETYDQRTRTVGCENKSEPEEVVEIDDSHEDGERIVLHRLEAESEVRTVDNNVRDDAHDETSYKSCYESKSSDYKTLDSIALKESSDPSAESKQSADPTQLMNGSGEFKKYETDATLSAESDAFSGCETPVVLGDVKKVDVKMSSFGTKDLDNIELISISDHDMSNADDSARNIALTKTVQVEREIGMYVKLKCLLQFDESVKEFLGKELTAVHCEPIVLESVRQKNDDTASSLADISDNKEGSPGSVNSNVQLYHLNPSRLSIMSSISSSSSASSAASLAMRLALKDSTHFSLPRGPAKHAKKATQDMPLSAMGDKQALDESYERLTREWSNNRLLTTTILNCANAELNTTDTYNISNERLDDHHLRKMHSSTPEFAAIGSEIELTVTPKSTKKSKSAKRPRNKTTRLIGERANSQQSKSGTTAPNNTSILHDSAIEHGEPSRKKIKLESNGAAESSKLLISDTEVLANSSPLPFDDLIGKSVFAKWSDNNYYPGTVIDRLKTKYKVNFYDNQSKTLIPEFVIPMPKTLKEGLSVYATTEANGYGLCGIIVNVQSANGDDVYYTVETDESERLHVQVKNIFLSSDQAQVLKEEVDSESSKALPTTPKHLAQVSLDNMVEGKRRSKRIGTPIFSTPKSSGSSSTSKTKSEPSVSGVTAKLKKKSALFENEGVSSDSNVETATPSDESVLQGVQREIIGTPYEQIVKGPLSRIKSRPRSKKKVEDEQTIATLGPIPPTNSNIFVGVSFILTCASLDTLDRWYQERKSCTEDTETDNETESEEIWSERPFVRDRLQTQIIAGGGKVYEEFNAIPKSEYESTKLITNVPNTTAKSILCLSVGIRAYNHRWIIRCCSEGKLVNEAEEVLPSGWSLYKRDYVDAFQVSGNKPLSKVVVIIPDLISDIQFTIFWRQVCENAGAVVLIAEHLENMEIMDFDSDTVVLSNMRCPSWAVDKANQLRIPVLSTTWVIQCLIESKLCSYNFHERYRYNYTPN